MGSEDPQQNFFITLLESAIIKTIITVVKDSKRKEIHAGHGDVIIIESLVMIRDT